ncbi:hypothetical protein C8Q73DRAFT_438994 [Cubamyces lactineus]|nr:hypothetical protein C8Q73DRAFT_438994 [Cubamyces lactineus]
MIRICASPTRYIYVVLRFTHVCCMYIPHPAARWRISIAHGHARIDHRPSQTLNLSYTRLRTRSLYASMGLGAEVLRSLAIVIHVTVSCYWVMCARVSSGVGTCTFVCVSICTTVYMLSYTAPPSSGRPSSPGGGAWEVSVSVSTRL